MSRNPPNGFHILDTGPVESSLQRNTKHKIKLHTLRMSDKQNRANRISIHHTTASLALQHRLRRAFSYSHRGWSPKCQMVSAAGYWVLLVEGIQINSHFRTRRYPNIKADRVRSSVLLVVSRYSLQMGTAAGWCRNTIT